MSIADDGLHTPEVGQWAERKYRLLAYYARMFSTSMKRKWDRRVYIDPYCGAGHARIKGTSRRVATSALLALDVPDPFDHYVFCDLDPKCIEALRVRAGRNRSMKQVDYMIGDANDLVTDVVELIMHNRRYGRTLSLCVLDPYSMANLRFATIERLAELFMDFLVLIPSYMDANRNEAVYMDPGNRIVERFLGNPSWRAQWSKARSEFGTFIVDQFGRSMAKLGFIYRGPGEEVLVRIPKKNVSLYHLAFYSKKEIGMRFWRTARVGSDEQLSLFE